MQPNPTMRCNWKTAAVMVAALLGLLPAWCGLAAEPLYKNPAQPVEKRVEDLLARMTVEEKVAQISGWWSADEVKLRAEGKIFTPEFYATMGAKGLGQIGPINLSIEEDLKQYRAIQDYFLNKTRLGIPLLRHAECSHGLMRFGATSFPAPSGLACCWNPELVEAAYDQAGRETAARGVQSVLSPVVDVARELRYGRVDETLGEDPFLVSRLGAAMIRGLQGSTNGVIAPGHVAATLKHFVGFASPEGGLGKSQYVSSPRNLLDVEVYPFRHIIATARPAAIMAAYNTVDGVPCHVNHWLLTEVLRGELGFTGLVVADYGGINQVCSVMKLAQSDAEAGRLALLAGVQVELPNNDSFKSLPKLIQENKVDPKILDQAVRAVLDLKFRVGAFENPVLDVVKARELPASAEAGRLALEAARQSMVLLKNENNLLPLDPGKKQRIAVIGPNADVCRLGSYSGTPDKTVSLLDGILAYLGGDTSRVTHAQGCVIAHNDAKNSYLNWRQVGVAQFATLKDNAPLIEQAVKVALAADVVVLALGENALLAREAWGNTHLGDRSTLDLTESQQELARAVLDTGKPVILYLAHGKPITLGRLGERFQAILTGHYAGQATGTAAAEIIFGAVAPSGKLAMSWPRSVGHQPACYSRQTGSANWPYVDSPFDPVFPFGHGLSYTTFKYGKVSLSSGTIRPGGSVDVSVELTNTGSRSGTEVVQLYVTGQHLGMVRPGLELKGFGRVTLEPGKSQTILLKLNAEDLMFHDAALKRVLPAGGEFLVSVGGSSAVRTKPVVLSTGN